MNRISLGTWTIRWSLTQLNYRRIDRSHQGALDHDLAEPFAGPDGAMAMGTLPLVVTLTLAGVGTGRFV